MAGDFLNRCEIMPGSDGKGIVDWVVCFRKEIGSKWDWSLPPGKCGELWIMDVGIKNRSHCRLWWWCHWRKTEWKTKLDHKLSTSCVAYDQTSHRSLRMSCPFFSLHPCYAHSKVFYFNRQARRKKFINNIWWKTISVSSVPLQPLEIMERISWHQYQLPSTSQKHYSWEI